MQGPSERHALEERLRQLRPGDHLCCIYQTEQEHRLLLTSYMRQGLERGEKVLYIVDARTAEEVLGYLTRDGVDAAPHLEEGRLVILDADASYLKDGVFDPDGMIALLRQKTEQALEEGYASLRVTGEMTWALRGRDGSQRLMEYEAKLNRFLPESRCIAICQYDRRRFAPGVLLDVLATHPIAVIGTEFLDNFYYMPPEDFLGPEPEARRLESWLESLHERKKAEESVQTLRMIVESSEDAIIGLETEGTILSWNRGAERIYGYETGEVVGKPLALLYPTGRANEADDLCEDAENGRMLRHHETVHQRKDGGAVPVSLTLAPVREKVGHVLCASLVVRDISDLKKAEEDRIARIKEEILSLEGMHSSVSTRVSAGAYGLVSLQEALPETFQELVRQFEDVLDLALQSSVYKVRSRITKRLQALSDHLGFLRAGPRDVVEIYTRALKHKSGEAPWAKAQAYVSEGRLMALELMGHLTAYYRQETGQAVSRHREASAQTPAGG